MLAKVSTLATARATLDKCARKTTARATNAANAAASNIAYWSARKLQRKLKRPKVHLGRSKMAKAAARKVVAADGE